jgi:hypothetical protein
MSAFATSLLRSLAQKVLGMLFVWVGVHFIAVPEHVRSAVTDWAVLLVTTLLLFVWTSAVRWLETRRGDTPFDVYARALARILMLGIKSKPFYFDTSKPAKLLDSSKPNEVVLAPPAVSPPEPPTTTVDPGGNPL